jgi:CHAT domain-containing protein/tetratricopeptide (TPR) repeat protein
VLGLLVGAWTAAGDEPPPKTEAKPPWQRLLQGDDAKQMANLQMQFDQLLQTGKYTEAIEVAKQQLKQRERLQGADHYEVADARRLLELVEKVARFDKQQQADHQHSLAVAHQARVLDDKERYAQAQPLWEQALAQCRQLLGEEHPETAILFNSLSWNLYAQKKYAEADTACRKALAIRRQALGEDHPDTAESYSNHAEALAALGKFAEAEDGYRKALTLRRRLLGEDHPDTAASYRNFAGDLDAQGKYAEAEDSHRQALVLFRKLRGEDDAETATCYNRLANNLQEQRKFPEAEENYRKVLALDRKHLGEEHPFTAASYNNLAFCLTKEGKFAEAEENNRTALALRRQLLGEEHGDTLISYNNLANSLDRQGKYAEAEEYQRKALALAREVYGDEDPETARAYASLAIFLNHQGRHKEAEEYHRQSLTLRLKRLGEEHPDTATSYSGLASDLDSQGRYKEGEDLHRKALALRQRRLGEGHPDTSASYNNLAHNLYLQGKFSEAEAGFRKALAIDLQVLGEEHPDTAVAFNNLATSLQAQGRYAEAEESFRKALAVRRRWLGEDHPYTALTYHNLAFSLAGQRRRPDAEEALRHAADALAHIRPGLATSGLGRAIAGRDFPFPFLAALLAPHQPEDAWERFEQGLGRGTWDDLNARLGRSPAEQAHLADLARHLERLEAGLVESGTGKQLTEEQTRRHKDQLAQRRQAQEQLDVLIRTLAEKYGISEARPYALEQIQAALAPDTALIGWVDVAGLGQDTGGVNEHWALVLRARGKPAWVPLPGSGRDKSWTDADTHLPTELAVSLRARPQAGEADWRPLAQRLSRQRLEPLTPHLAATADLPAVRHLAVLPSQVMAGVPLEVLSDRYTVCRAPSATVFAFLRGKPRPQTTGLLALADPVFDRPDGDAKQEPLPPGGLLLTAVVPGSNASRASLRAGDVLLRYQSRELKTMADLRLQAPSADTAARIPVAIWRAGETLALEVAPGLLGVTVAREPAPEALARRRHINAELVASRGDGSWKALPGTRVEVEALARRFHDAHSPVTVLTDSDASEQRLTSLATDGSLAKVRYLHLATHGSVNWDFPLQSAVILSRDHLPDPTKQRDASQPVFDGRLTAAEVLRSWNLEADLVTLSACETGLGQYASGEGFMGFAQALLICGTRSVCLSLWQVDDVATALLMDRFYANLLGQRDGLKQSLGKAEALAEAKVWLRTLSRAEAVKLAAKVTGGVERGKGRPALPQAPVVPETDKDEPPYAHPYYWAAFVLVGDKD